MAANRCSRLIISSLFVSSIFHCLTIGQRSSRVSAWTLLMSQRELLCADEDADLLQSKPKKKKRLWMKIIREGEEVQLVKQEQLIKCTSYQSNQ